MECFWCVSGYKANAKVLQDFCSPATDDDLSHKVQLNLTGCLDCVMAYHYARQYFLKRKESSRKELFSWEVSRLCEHMKKSLHSDTYNSDEEREMLFEDDLLEMLSISLQEILIYPYLLWSKQLTSLATEALLRLEAEGTPLPLDSKLPGVYLLVIHPNPQVQKWAKSAVHFLGSISCDDFDDLRDVIKWIINVSEFGLLSSEDLEITNDEILPTHLFQNNKKEYWASVCTFLKKFEARTMRLQLLSRDHHDQFINILINAIDQENCRNSGRDSEFWSLLNCLLILFKRLESRIWQHVNLKKHTDLFLLVVLHPAYLTELQQLPGYKMKDVDVKDEPSALSGPDDDKKDDQPERVTDSSQSLHVMMFTWLKRFLESVVVFGDSAKKAVKVVFKYFSCLKDELEIPSQGYDDTMVAMISCLEFLLKNSLQSFLNIAAKRWIPDVLEILSLDLDQLSAGQEQAVSFCKLFLQNEEEIPRDVCRNLIVWLDGKSEIDEDYELRNLGLLENLLMSHFRNLPPVTRNFDRERRTINLPKTSKDRSSNSIKSSASRKIASVSMTPHSTPRKSHGTTVTSPLLDGKVLLKKLDVLKTSIRKSLILSDCANDDELLKGLKQDSDIEDVQKSHDTIIISDSSDDDEPLGKRCSKNSLLDKDVQNNVETIYISDSSSDEERLICSGKRVGDEASLPTVCKRKCVEEKMDRLDLSKYEVSGLEEQKKECEDTAVTNSFCVEVGVSAEYSGNFARKTSTFVINDTEMVDITDEEGKGNFVETDTVILDVNDTYMVDITDECKGNFVETDTVILDVNDTYMDTTIAIVNVDNKVDLLESRHHEELVADERKNGGEKAANGFPFESPPSNLEPSLENKGTASTGINLEDKMRPSESLQESEVKEQRKESGEAVTANLPVQDATKETKIGSLEVREPEVLVTKKQKEAEGGKTSISNLSSVGATSNTKSAGVITLKNAAVAPHAKVPVIKPVDASVANKENRKKALETKPKKLLTIEELYHVILKWDPSMLMKQFTPDIANAGKVRLTFESTDDYYSVFKPLLFLEFWAQALREWQQARNHKEDIIVVKSIKDFVHRFLLVVCHQHVITTNKAEEKFFREKDLVMLKLKDEKLRLLFAVVESVKHMSSSNAPGDGNPAQSGVEYFDLTITLRLIPKERPLLVNEKIRCVLVTSLITTLRQWKGLMFFPRSLLARDILQPRIDKCCNISLQAEKTAAAEQVYNKSQAAAIDGTVAALRLPYPIPRISFIQGPPGTGKSHTIIGLLKSYLENREKDISAEKGNRLPGSKSLVGIQTSGKILLCAPSNAAVYVLVRRIIAEMKSTTTDNCAGKNKNCGSINLVCVGRTSVLHPEILPFALETLVKVELSKRSSNNHGNERIAYGKVDSLREKIESLGKKVYQLRLAGFQHDSYEVKCINSEVEAMVKKKQMLEKEYIDIRRSRQMLKREEEKIRKSILLSADVICCTLSASGSPLLHKLKTSIAHVPFGCVIVDEACQSCELDLLIPLQFGSSKLVMVGDPEQLRSTVLSKKAQELLLGQSMYERLYKVFKKRAHNTGRALHATKDNPIQLLDLQYRMHPEISFFPAKYVYQGRVKDERSLATRKCISSIKPYALLNVRDGIEQNSPCGSLCNPVESGLVVEICLLLQKEVSENHFGIITPYRAQVNLIRNRLAQGGLKKVEVDTVDGFQGREKDFVVMSCVRAGKDPQRGIGFLADRTRLNVALTRAKYALIILLNVNSLETNPDWRACIDDARKRGVLYDVISTKDLSRVFEKSHATETDRIPNSKASNSSLPLTSTKDCLTSKTNLSNRNVFTGCNNQNSRSSILSTTNVVPSTRVRANSGRGETSTSKIPLPDVTLRGGSATNGNISSSDEFDFDDHDPYICKTRTADKTDSGEKHGGKS